MEQFELTKYYLLVYKINEQQFFEVDSSLNMLPTLWLIEIIKLLPLCYNGHIKELSSNLLDIGKIIKIIT